ncbi:SPOR domain-containing protein [Aquipuribacter sp. MA13-6]|uniref:SPOR domain-containing protein n=1 Tax=unclassified Aquipuribacter TaxID=2635084 RepID=UPI003EEBDC6F
MAEDTQQFWFNTETKQVEQGRQSHYTNRMGPYPTREAASKALETAAARTEKWDEEDEGWEKGPQG